jgi:predicted nuclease of predicted toxin-antitoxin system
MRTSARASLAHWLISSPTVPSNLVGLGSTTDQEIWANAREHGFAVISKDDDFRSLSLVNGAPPKVIWLRIGNASTAGIEAFIRSALVKIRTFEISPEESLLVLS